MPTVDGTIIIEAPCREVFALSQAYDLRLEWDPFLRDLRFLDGATEAGLGVRVWVKARHGLTMIVEYTVYTPPERVAMAMVNGHWLFASFAGSWVFRGRGDHTEVTFRYGFTLRRGLDWLMRAAVARIFSRDIERRLEALKRSAETTDILSRI